MSAQYGWNTIFWTANLWRIFAGTVKPWTIDDTGNINTPNEGMGSISNIGSLKEYASEPPVIPATLEAAAANIRSGVMGPYDTKDMLLSSSRKCKNRMVPIKGLLKELF